MKAKPRVQAGLQKLIAAGRRMDSSGLMGTFSRLLGGWMNAQTGVGTDTDKAAATTFSRPAILSPQECSDLFHFDDLAQAICLEIVKDALREGIEIEKKQAEDVEAEEPREDAADPFAGDVEETQEEIEGAEVPEYQTAEEDPDKELLERLEKRVDDWKVLALAKQAGALARAMGGAGIILGTRGDVFANQELFDEDITELVFLRVADRLELTVASYYPADHPKFGRPATFWYQPRVAGGMTSGQVEIHESRIVWFPGALTSEAERAFNQGFEHSALQQAYNSLARVNHSFDSVATMLSDMSQSVYKIAGLFDLIAEEGSTEGFAKRAAILDMFRSITRAVVLDAESGEDFEFRERGAVTGIDGLLDKLMLRLASAARMPATRLWGQSPAGMDATGDNDTRMWYDRVEDYRGDITDPITRLVRIIARCEFPEIDPEELEICWPSLWQMTPTEEATHRKTIAETDKINIDAGIHLPDEVAIHRYGQGGYTDQPVIVDTDARKAMLKSDLENAMKPPMPPPLPGAPVDPNAPPMPPQEDPASAPPSD